MTVFAVLLFLMILCKEVKFIEDGINDYLYCVSGAWSAKKRYHKLKIQGSYDGAYIRFRGYRLFLHDFILIGG